jgi:hypothetical protein
MNEQEKESLEIKETDNEVQERANNKEFDWILSLKKAYQEHVKREDLLQIEQNQKIPPK